MRIAMVSEHASPLAVLGGPDAGGQNVHVAQLARTLAHRGHRVTVYTRRDAAELPERVPLDPGVVIEHVPVGPARPVPKDTLYEHMRGFGAYLARSWAEDPPDVVHAHFWMSGMAALIGARDHGVPVVQTFHALGTVKRRHQGVEDTSPDERLGVERRVGRGCSRILATCTDEVFELTAMGVPPRQTSVVPCGVDTDRFRPSPEDTDPVADGGTRTGHRGPNPNPNPNASTKAGTSGHATGTGARTRAGTGARTGAGAAGVGNRGGIGRCARHRLLAIGRLVPRKGFHQAIEALQHLPDTELLIAGGPEPALLATDPEAERLRRLAGSCGVEERVEFLGAVPHHRMPELIRSADLVVSTPSYEPFGIVPLEAMACGVPVVATGVGGHLDSVADRITGRLVPPGDTGALARAVRELTGSPELLRSYGRAGRERALARFSWERVADGVEQVYRQVAARHRVPTGAGR